MPYYSRLQVHLVGLISQTITDHGSLGGLGDNDHPQYTLGTGIRIVEAITQTAYDALGTKVATTLYVITG